jgi:EAL domain-containing protein (putative c-di-GMP-specific phosphodiesterase class I)
MYQVKEKGGAASQVIDLAQQKLAVDQASMRMDLGLAIERHELRLEYQPIVRTRDSCVMGAEALLRWDHPTRGVVAPMILIPLAEESATMAEIGRWVLTQACVDRHQWGHQQVRDTFSMSVNVSAHQLLTADFERMVSSVLEATNTRPDLLTLEITESVFTRDAQRALIVLSGLKDLGLGIALDDFGTGYSSLRYLRRFPVDYVKLDQGFTSDLGNDRGGRAIVAKVIELAHLLDLKVVTEGVETEEQHHEVQALGSDLSQGFYFGRPVASDLLVTSAA